MTRKQRRMAFLGGGLACLAGAVALVLVALDDKVTFFFSPSELVAQPVAADTRIRLGGLVADGSVEKLADGLTTLFVVTDLAHDVTVSYTGVLPDLFREGQGVIVAGHLRDSDLFVADEVLAKHDENYMPSEVVDALKAGGHWEETR